MELTQLIFPILSIGGLAILFAFVLGYASKKFAVEVDERVPLIKEILPGANCGGCGFAGCDAYAQAVVDGTAATNCCAVAGAAGAEKISKIMGVEVSDTEPLKAFIKCKGTCNNAKQKGNYYGTMDCREAVVIPGAGNKACEYGCLGLGSCVKACKFDAIDIVDGVAVVNPDNCVGCGACAKACPKGVVELMPLSQVVRVACNSKNKLKEVKDACSVGCITCQLCARSCSEGAITFENNLPKVDKEKCVECFACIEKCPTKALIAYGKEIKLKKAE